MFKDRKEAGISLAKILKIYKNKEDVLVLGIPRGGVEVAFYVCKELNLPLGVLVVKKLGHPINSELAIGAVSADDFYLNNDLIESEDISKKYLWEQIKLKQKEIKKNYKKFESTNYNLKNKKVIIVDDGAATGATMVLAANLVKKKAKQVIVGLPVASLEAVAKIKKITDKIFCVLVPSDLSAIGQYYSNFLPVEDEKVRELLS